MCNLNRSPTGEEVFREMMYEKGKIVGSLWEESNSDVKVGSAGTSVNFYGVLARQYFEWMGTRADFIFAADRFVYDDLTGYFKTSPEKVIDLEIPDIYNVNDPNDKLALRNLLRGKLEEFLEDKTLK